MKNVLANEGAALAAEAADKFMLLELSRFFEFEMRFRNARLNQPGMLSRLYQVIDEIKNEVNHSVFSECVDLCIEAFFWKIDYGAWNAAQIDDLQHEIPGLRFSEIVQLFEMLRCKFGEELFSAKSQLPSLANYGFDVFLIKNNIWEVYYWWELINNRNNRIKWGLCGQMGSIGETVCKVVGAESFDGLEEIIAAVNNIEMPAVIPQKKRLLSNVPMERFAVIDADRQEICVDGVVQEGSLWLGARYGSVWSGDYQAVSDLFWRDFEIQQALGGRQKPDAPWDNKQATTTVNVEDEKEAELTTPPSILFETFERLSPHLKREGWVKPDDVLSYLCGLLIWDGYHIERGKGYGNLQVSIVDFLKIVGNDKKIYNTRSSDYSVCREYYEDVRVRIRDCRFPWK